MRGSRERRVRRRIPIAATALHDRRREILADLEPIPGARMRYAALLGLSAAIATSGLLAGSPAVVIGAMIIAPLLTPIQRIAISVALWRGRPLLTNGAVLVGSVLGSVLLAAALTRVVPGASLTDEVLLRTSPGILDLVIAGAAGMAGAYALVRRDVSDALPGVAIAVALMPPLAAIGITVQLRRFDLAAGAALLFATNLVVIAFAALAILFASGIVPVRRAGSRRGAVAAIAGGAFALLALAVPLARASAHAAATAERNRELSLAVADWVRGDPSFTVKGIKVKDRNVTVEIAGPKEPPSATPLAEDVRRIVGPEAIVDIRWQQQNQLGDERRDGLTDEQAAELEERVREWLADNATGDDVAAIAVTGDRVVIDVIGPVEPLQSAGLRDAVSSVLGGQIQPELHWTPRYTVQPKRSAAVAGVVRDWAERAGVTILTLRVDIERSTVHVDVAGSAPPPSDRLEAALRTLWAVQLLPGIPQVTIGYAQLTPILTAPPPTVPAPSSQNPPPGQPGSPAP